MAWLMHINASMRIYRFILALILPVLLSACIGGIDTGGGGGGGDVGAPTLEIAGVADSQIVLAWTPDPTNPGDTYQLNRDAVAIYTGPDTAYNDLGLINGRTYCYTASAITGTNVATSTQVCATPMAGTVLTITNQSLAANLAWDEVEGAISYNLYLDGSFLSPSLSKGTDKANGDEEDLLFANVAAPTTTYDMTGYYDRDGAWIPLSNNCVEYPVIIRPVDIAGNEGPESTQIAEPDTEGVLDTTFGDAGRVTVVGATNGTFFGLHVLEDDTIVGLVNGDDSILIGYPDDVGAAMTPLWSVWFEATMDTALAMTVDADENIYVAGSDAGNAKLCRFIPDGGGYAFDTAGFGAGGCYEFVSGDSTLVNDIVLDSEGRIIMAGSTGPALGWEITLWRVAADGSGLDGWDSAAIIDPSLYDNGEAFQLAGDNWSYASGVTIAENDSGQGRIVVSIEKENGAGVRGGYYYEIDEGWTVEDSVNVTPMSGGATDVVTLADDRVLFSLYDTAAIPGSYIQDVSLSPLSVEDTFFYEEDPIEHEEANKIVLDCHDRALIAGTAGSDQDPTIFRTDENFNIDLNFAVDGWYLYPSPLGFGGDGFAIAFDGRGRILVGGRISSFVSTQPVLIRLK